MYQVLLCAKWKKMCTNPEQKHKDMETVNANMKARYKRFKMQRAGVPEGEKGIYGEVKIR